MDYIPLFFPAFSVNYNFRSKCKKNVLQIVIKDWNRLPRAVTTPEEIKSYVDVALGTWFSAGLAVKTMWVNS